ncbi:endoplasmic reticulum membrane-associated RNA degradation protein [Bombina bombina]|uniref:endoplasmic reticulum membrane-associated RNA degradation protein n=1 Tax=Bombina bombina TaxID=8345 RepID=UPI00235A5B2C|nr:endoplasmic reticulum membrane-associated RNA degradation protein [Bombina bombina]
MVPMNEESQTSIALQPAQWGDTVLKTFPNTTCLSNKVHNMVCRLGFEIQCSYDIERLLSQDNEVCWISLTDHLSYKPSGQLDFAECVRQLGPVCEAVHLYLTSLSSEVFDVQFQGFFQWTDNAELFLNTLAVLKSLDGAKISLSLMKITSCLEHSLGDVFLMLGKECPFLLRDLLASLELANIFSQSVMDVLRVFIGSPESLNLRNILWHGFASSSEIPPKYCSMLLLLTAGLGQILKTYLCRTNSLLVHRPYFAFYSQKDVFVFPDITNEMLSVAEKLVKKSKFVLKHMVPLWIEALTAFRQDRYADSAVLLLPQLETGLRLIFITVNKCPERILTAESAILYTTFDEILAKRLNAHSENLVPKILGEAAMEFLWDFLNHPEGPRVRDHLSHGEIQLSEFPKQIANQLLGFSIALLYKHTDKEDNPIKEISLLYPLIDAVEHYRSRFHPISLLQKQVLECSESLQKLPLLPSPTLDQPQHNEVLDDIAEAGELFNQEIIHILSLLPLQEECCFDDVDSWLITEKWFSTMKELCNTHIRTLYCNRSVLEAVGVLRKVSAQCHLVSKNVISALELRYEQWLNKTLRSRQRQNYIRMLSFIKILTPVLRLIVTLVSMDMSDIHAISEKTSLVYQEYLKYIKSLLQYTENMATCTSIEKNLWDKAIELTRKILLKIRLFHEKQNSSQVMKDTDQDNL